MPTSKRLKDDLFATNLLKWWPSNRRQFPWRKDKDPYHILIAEQLLRKTSARQVQRVYEKFLKRFDDPNDLALASPKEISELIRPLGIEKRRGVTLHELGLAITKQFHGKVPMSRDALLTLPGVGEYAADALLSLVAGDKLPMVDSNSLRVFSRVFSIELPSNHRKAIRTVRAFMLPLVRKYEAKKLNLAILDFAALVCTARDPKCPACPIRRFCNHTRHASRLKPSCAFCQ